MDVRLWRRWLKEVPGERGKSWVPDGRLADSCGGGWAWGAPQAGDGAGGKSSSSSNNWEFGAGGQLKVSSTALDWCSL
jgi:hypothetical protein